MGEIEFIDELSWGHIRQGYKLMTHYHPDTLGGDQRPGAQELVTPLGCDHTGLD